MSRTYEKGGYEWQKWHAHKTYRPDRNVWVRATDCLIAERFFGYVWQPCSPHADFCGYPFYVVLTLTTEPPLYPEWRSYILEPDTHVPNFSSSLGDALRLARLLGWDTIKVLPDDQAMAAWICQRALAE